MPEIETWSLIMCIIFLAMHLHVVTVRVLKKSYCAFDTKLYVSAMIPVFRVHGCKTSANSKGKQMAENCCSAAHNMESPIM